MLGPDRGSETSSPPIPKGRQGIVSHLRQDEPLSGIRPRGSLTVRRPVGVLIKQLQVCELFRGSA